MKTQTVQLGEVCEFIYGDALKEENRRSGKVPVYGSNGVVGWHDKALTGGATIVIGRKGSIGEVNWSNGPCFPIDTTYYVEKTERPCDLRWLYYTLLKLDLTRLNKSAAVPGLNRDDAYEQHILFPDVPEQERIAALLDQADRLRRTRRYALELTHAFLPAAFLELFGDPEKNSLGWPESELGELCEEVLDCPHSTPIYTAIQTPHPCVRSSDIQRGYLDFSEAKYVSPCEYQKRTARGKPMPGDVIYCREGARFGNAGRIIDKTEMCLGQRTMLFRANSKVAVSEYIWAFLSSRGAYRQATRALDGSASPHVNVGEIVTFRVPVPPLPLQHRFLSMCERVDHLRALQREALGQAEHLFASLLRRAFSG
jgi:type I restriction enzyme, S subunit